MKALGKSWIAVAAQRTPANKKATGQATVVLEVASKSKAIGQATDVRKHVLKPKATGQATDARKHVLKPKATGQATVVLEAASKSKNKGGVPFGAVLRCMMHVPHLRTKKTAGVLPTRVLG
ncbi:hypothetical protein M885DRAFT_623168 [Pelagophyceae sp. CCMP2097]|nr:hypothetical protein M885DRAFT_623168 [Pelagophyceae sp. CCMP2097]